ncbi:MAG: prepilin-type N-terminal cleavage/methylation domain-containing protein [Candidatus Saccharimonas sp.]
MNKLITNYRLKLKALFRKNYRFSYSLKSKKFNFGFTIVELLIVIVIIAILATITIVAYKGIQQRAYGAKAQAAADSYLNLFEMYNLDNGSYPDTNGSYVCLGSSTEYASSGDFDEGQCVGGDYYAYEDTDLQHDLQKFSPTLPSAQLPTVNSEYRGLVYTGDPDGGKILYVLKGDDQSCPKGQKDDLHYGNNTACIITVGDDFCWGSPGDQ